MSEYSEAYRRRRPDPRLVEALTHHLPSPPSRLLDLGSGPGNYTALFAQRGYDVLALDKSLDMLVDVPDTFAPSRICADADCLPLRDGEVDSVVCILALHQFKDWRTALRECVRVSRSFSICLVVFDRQSPQEFWLTDYFPSVWRNAYSHTPTCTEIAEHLQSLSGHATSITVFPISRDFIDMWLVAGWCRPELYLSAEYRAANSSFARADVTEVNAGLRRLEYDMRSGQWRQRYGGIMNLTSYDAGYRIITTNRRR